MKTYVALLRGIGPMNPNMRPTKLKEAFEGMGFKNVRTVISSGNVVFESGFKDSAKLETKIEKALPKLLGFTSTTIVRSQEELEKLVMEDPAKGITHGQESYVLVTFLKQHSPKIRTLARKGTGYEIVGKYEREICIVVDLTNSKTPDIMRWLEKELSKNITSRTWQTVLRILKKMNIDT
jgi:uncharacterized protein (DUF1697 family)